jgi:Na+-translocating ferredoxin:NAD+ oxidoreductase RnfE subunit
MLLVLPFGGFLTLGCLIALMQYLRTRSAAKKDKEASK